MAVNDIRVRKIIDHALAYVKNGSNDESCCGSIRVAWQKLKAWRDEKPASGKKANFLDLDVAAAENYMFARACVCEGFVNQVQMHTITLGYFASKVVGIEMPTSDNPQSPPDSGVLRWGAKGTQEGMDDRQRCNKHANPPLWRPVNEIMPLGKGYKGALGKPVLGTNPQASKCFGCVCRLTFDMRGGARA